MSTTTSTSHGIGVFGLLGVVFVTLKLIGIVDWSWWLVTIPFWGGFAVFFILLTIALVVAVVNAFLEKS